MISGREMRENKESQDNGAQEITGKVRISSPLRMDLDTIRVFAISSNGLTRSASGNPRC